MSNSKLRAASSEFASTDPSALVAALVESYQRITGTTVHPASPERIWIAWIADILVQTRAQINYAAAQNLPSTAQGKNLDALAELFYTQTRPAAQPAICKIQFRISEAQSSAILIPLGTRLTDVENTLIWETTADAYIDIGNTDTTVQARCQTSGMIGNGFVAGQINTLVDIFPYYIRAENVSTSDGGTNEATDEEFLELLRASEDAYSTAGPVGAYVYLAKSVSTEIADVKAIQPNRQISKSIPVHAGHAFLGGDGLNAATLEVFASGTHAAAALESDYTVDYTDSLLDISIQPGGALASAEQLEVRITAVGAGQVAIYALMEDGTIAGETIKEMIGAACSADEARPLTDLVSVEDPVQVPYDLTLTYYTPRGTTSATEIKDRIDAAVKDYVAWQCGKLGRDINPSQLQAMLMSTGIKRVEITSPTFRRLKNGRDHDAPEVAKIGKINVADGGYEDD